MNEKKSDRLNTKQLYEILPKMGAVLAALIFWQCAAMYIHQKILLVSPIAVLVRLTSLCREQDFWSGVGFTFCHIATGFFLGLMIGILLAALAARSRWIETLLWPWITAAKSVPVASFVVICLIWLSPRNLSVFISFLVVVPVVYQNLLTGLKTTDVQMEELAAVFHLSGFRKLRYITLPRLTPFITAACKLTTGMAWKAGVAAEIIGNPAGSIGKQMSTAKMYLDTDDLLAWVVVVVLLSVLFGKAFMKLLHLLLNELTGEGGL